MLPDRAQGPLSTQRVFFPTPPPLLPKARPASLPVPGASPSLEPHNWPGHPVSGQEAPLGLPPPDLQPLLSSLPSCLPSASFLLSLTQKHRHFFSPFYYCPWLYYSSIPRTYDNAEELSGALRHQPWCESTSALKAAFRKWGVEVSPAISPL